MSRSREILIFKIVIVSAFSLSPSTVSRERADNRCNEVGSIRDEESSNEIVPDV